MLNGIKLTVAVPVFNMEPYLRLTTSPPMWKSAAL